MDPMALSLALGALSVLPLSVFLQPWWPKWLRVAFVYVVCLAIGVEVAGAAGRLHVPTSAFDAATIFGDVTAVLIASQAVYTGLAKTPLLNAIENATDTRRIPSIGLRAPVVVGPSALAREEAAPAAVVVPTEAGYHIARRPVSAPPRPDTGSTPVTNPDTTLAG